MMQRPIGVRCIIVNKDHKATAEQVATQVKGVRKVVNDKIYL
jgi:osmotically-inducible protein OsmY